MLNPCILKLHADPSLCFSRSGVAVGKKPTAVPQLAISIHSATPDPSTCASVPTVVHRPGHIMATQPAPTASSASGHGSSDFPPDSKLVCLLTFDFLLFVNCRNADRSLLRNLVEPLINSQRQTLLSQLSLPIVDALFANLRLETDEG